MTENPMVSWLRSTLDELERVARDADAAHSEPWLYEGGHQIGGAFEGVCETSDAGVDVLPHIALNDPRSVLARVQAERQLLKLHRPRIWTSLDSNQQPDEGYDCVVCFAARDDAEKWPCDTLRWLAYGHRFDADGFDPAWSLEGVETPS